MKKKMLALVLSVAIMAGLFIVPANAVNIEDAGASARIPKNVAEIIASFFISDFQSMPDTTWTAETKIADVVTMHDVDGSISAYTCELETAGTEAGYVIVSAYPDAENVILEFSDVAAPLYDKFDIQEEDSIIYTGTLNYFLAVDSDQLLTVDQFTIDRDEVPTPLADNFDAISRTGVQPLNGANYPISDPFEWATAVYGGTFTAIDWKNPFENSCTYRTSGEFRTINGITYYKSCGPTAITNLIELVGISNNYTTVMSKKPWEIFQTVARLGIDKGYYVNSYTNLGGTPDDTTPNYIRDAFRAFGITVSTTSTTNVVYSKVKAAIDGYKPIYIATAYDHAYEYYQNHAMMAYAYTRIKNGAGRIKDFMKVADGQNFAGVYVPYGTSAYKIDAMYVVSIDKLG